jgi:hypothetical protein
LIAFPTIISIGDPGIAANDTATGVGTVITLVADVYQDCGIDKGGTGHTNSIACGFGGFLSSTKIY